MTDLYDFGETDLEPDVVEYLRRNCKKSLKNPDSLKVSDLAALNIVEVDGREMFVWEYPSSGPDEMWVTAELDEDGQWVYATRTKPDYGPPKPGYEQLEVVIYESNESKTFKIEFVAKSAEEWGIDDREIETSNDGCTKLNVSAVVDDQLTIKGFLGSPECT